MMIDKTVLLIDDDPEFLQLISLLFKKSGAQIMTAHNGIEGVNKAFNHYPDIIILDIIMPGKNGFEVCQKIRQYSNIPIIMLSVLDQERDMLRALEAGADAFLTKPFNAEILLARVKALIRRHERGNGNPVAPSYNNGHLKIDFERHIVQVNDRLVRLTPVEFRLLFYLTSNANRVLSYQQILSNVWGSGYERNKDYVHVYISQLRTKFEENAKSPRYIQSVHGVGYLFEK